MVIAWFRSPGEAQIARARLEAEGIAATLASGNGYGIAVAADDVERALAILESIWPDESPAPERPAIDIERCPECGSGDLLRIRRLPFFIISTTLLLLAGHAVGQLDLFAILIAVIAGLLFFGPNRRCLSCNERWRSSVAPPPPPVRSEIAVEPPDVECPRCGSRETGPIDRRRMKAWTLLVNFVLPPLLLLWPFMPRRKCEECGHEWR
ncbi:MAG TPA: hypothetical protein VFT12_07700 [Thermoanaerobaculia bacterium]|nr:hypothetical protein [Thermoanaerobaculia bacterium]